MEYLKDYSTALKNESVPMWGHVYSACVHMPVHHQVQQYLQVEFCTNQHFHYQNQQLHAYLGNFML